MKSADTAAAPTCESIGAAMVAVAAIHRGEFNMTPDTGSPIAEVGIAAPSFAAVQLPSEIVLVLSIPGPEAQYP
jgi:hypothetical protein